MIPSSAAFDLTIPESVRIDAALSRLLRQSLRPASRGTAIRVERSWAWLEGGSPADGLEITEHLLPDGVDFDTFQSLLGELH
ncbi:MAG: hypothetical protein L6Q75_05370 [Burkholderiaceae bacterium]|nr:hypothetical protein [Burkholderiaceae bacterium]